ncbi:hypothetical protein GUY61_35955, partial [Streptomyces sp. GC420]|nr:hypothetical protein [Streptomyces sp. GC420]
MELNDTGSRPAAARSGSDMARDIHDSFQAVLDALDAARADLHAFG